MRVIKSMLFVLIMGLILSCTNSNKNISTEQFAQIVDITTKDFQFQNVPESIPAGLTTFRVNNEGIFPHNAQLVQITDGHSYEDFIGYLEQNNWNPPSWAIPMGGPSAPISGEGSEATLDLIPGNYAIVCGVPVPAAEPHYMKGMTRPLTVTTTDVDSSEVPQADISMKMDDYTFGISEQITAGKHTIKVKNTASQPHEFILVKLNEGKNANDMLSWLGKVINMDPAPLPEAPGIFLNGVSPMAKGVTNYISVNFEPGEYALICPFPDEESGKPHFMHGMVHQFSIE